MCVFTCCDIGCCARLGSSGGGLCRCKVGGGGLQSQHVKCLMNRLVSICWGFGDDGFGTCVKGECKLAPNGKMSKDSACVPSDYRRSQYVSLNWATWPFFIDWLDAPHPSVDSPKVGALLAFTVDLPVDDSNRLPFETPARVELRTGAPRMSLAFESIRGPIEWSADDPKGFFL